MKCVYLFIYDSPGFHRITVSFYDLMLDQIRRCALEPLVEVILNIRACVSGHCCFGGKLLQWEQLLCFMPIVQLITMDVKISKGH